MSESTGIAWTDHTFNPWWGCARWSAACRSCYADAWASRFGHDLWRKNGIRRITSDANWRTPLKWNRKAEAAGVPAKVFCASMGDVFEDHPALDEPRERLWDLIGRTPWLRWQLLTKRPENIPSMVPRSWMAAWPRNVWPGATVESQRFLADRVYALDAIPSRERFLSCEPLLSALDLYPFLERGVVTWVIVGGETGKRSRAMNLEWVDSIVGQCRGAGVPVFVKQLGEVVGGPTHKDIATFPPSLRVREYPMVVTS